MFFFFFLFFSFLSFISTLYTIIYLSSLITNPTWTWAFVFSEKKKSKHHQCPLYVFWNIRNFETDCVWKNWSRNNFLLNFKTLIFIFKIKKKSFTNLILVLNNISSLYFTITLLVVITNTNTIIIVINWHQHHYYPYCTSTITITTTLITNLILSSP